MRYVLIVAAVVLAWAPLVQPYLFVADDFPLAELFDLGLRNYSPEMFASQGVWRFLGSYFCGYLARLGGYAEPALIVIIHAAVVCLFYAATLRLWRHATLSLILALVFGVFPWGIGALTWAPASMAPVLLGMFLATIIVLDRAGDSTASQATALIVTAVVSLVASIIQENFVFVFGAAGLVAWLRGPMRKRFSALGPGLGSAIYLALYLAFKTEHMLKTPSFHPMAMVSTYARQYSLFDVFGPWFSPVTRGLIAYEWTAAHIAVMAVAAIVALAALSQVARSQPRADGWRPGLNELALVLALLAAAAVVFVVGGGFSMDTRKKYLLLPLLMWLAAWCWLRTGARPDRVTRPIAAAIALLCITGAATTWMNTAIWHHQVERQHALVRFIADNKISGDISVEWNPALLREWPQMTRGWGFELDADWVINLALAGQHAGPVHVGNDPRATRIRFDTISQQWQIAAR